MKSIPPDDADYDWFRSLLLDMVVDGLEAFDPARGNVVEYLQRRLTWRFFDLARDRSNRRKALAVTPSHLPSTVKDLATENNRLEALSAIIIGQPPADHVLLRRLRISEVHRVFLYLRYFRHLSCKQIASRMDRNRRAVTNAIKLGRTRLRRLAAECDNDLANLRWETARAPEGPPFTQRHGDAFIRQCQAILANK